MSLASQPLRATDSGRPAVLPEGVWRADALATGVQQVVASGHAALDAQLPGGGWPLGALCELLQAHEGQAEWQLLLPALVLHACGSVVLVGAPKGHQPFAPGLQARGLPAHRLLWVRAEDAQSRWWACEQALRCAQVAAVLAWLPQAHAAALRRLHGAAQGRNTLLFAMRPLQEASTSSAAPLRLVLESEPSHVRAISPAMTTPSGLAPLRLRVLKRKGPPLTDPIHLPSVSDRLAAVLMAAQPQLEPAMRLEPALAEWPNTSSRDAWLRSPSLSSMPHALDCTGSAHLA